MGSEGVMPVRAAALCQPESGALQPEVGSACGEVIIEKASSKDQRGHNPQTPRGETAHGRTHPPTAPALPLTPPQPRAKPPPAACCSSWVQG